MKKILKMFKRHSVQVFGEKGSGKDLLFANVIARAEQKEYISNTDYHIEGKTHIPIDFDSLNLSCNDYTNFINGDLAYYDYPYKDNIDIYIADCGVYFPSQYCNELNKRYKYLPLFFALSRHLGNCGVHTNTQAINRVWDKIREQSTRYINTRGCVVLFGKFVIQEIRIYERFDSAQAQIQPFRSHLPLFADREKREIALQEKIRYINTHGKIETRYLFYVNKSDYDTRFFKQLLLQGVKSK